MTELDVLIINPPIRLSDKPRHIPHGLSILANIIRDKLEIIPTFLDINAHRYTEIETKKIISNTKFDVALIGGVSSTYNMILRLSKFIKSVNPNGKIISGGYVAMPIPKILLEKSDVDIICMGEGEITIVELLKRLGKNIDANLDDIAGICYKKNNERDKIVFTQSRPLIQNIDRESALPAYDLLDMEIYLSNPVVGMGRDIDFISSRGCPYSCTFCYQPWGHKPRFHSVDFIINAIAMLKEKYDIDFLSIQDDEFMADKARVIEFCEKINHYFPELLWSCTGRVNIISNDEKMVKIMKKAGCVLISYGFESGSQRMLDSMNKNITIKQMEKVVKVSREYEMPIPSSFIIGMPGEDDKSCKETLDFCTKNNIHLDSLMFATPYPGAEIFDFALKTGRIAYDNIHEFAMNLGDARDFTINLTDYFSDEELIDKRSEMMKIARQNYIDFITLDEIEAKTRKLFNTLLDKYPHDEKDLEHRMKHGGMSTF